MGNGAIVSSFATTYSAAAHDVASAANSLVSRHDSFSTLFHSAPAADEERIDLFNEKPTENNNKVLSCFTCHHYCMKSVEIRNAFVSFIRNYAWLMDISNDPFQVTKTLPFNNSGGTVNFHQYTVSIQTNSIKNEDENHVVHLINKMSIIQQLKINDSKDLDSCTSMSRSTKIQTCLSRSALVPVVIASLWPLFCETEEYKNISANLVISSKHSSLLATPNKSLKSYTLREKEVEKEAEDEFPSDPVSPFTPSSSHPSNNNPVPVTWTQLNMSLHSSFDKGSMRTAPFTPFSSSSQSVRFMSSKKSFLRSSISNANGSTLALTATVTLKDAKCKRIKDLYFQVVDDPLYEDKFSEFLKHGTWCHDLLASLDDHAFSLSISRPGPAMAEPPSVTISSIDNSFSSVGSGRMIGSGSGGGGSAGHPLVYVNKAFEALTQYSRDECLGKTCNFLHSEHTERGQIQLVSEALRTNMACKVALVNRRKDGSEFLNMLAMQPVYNLHGDVCYFVAVQYDVTKRDASIKDIKMIDDLLKMVANILK